MRVPFECGCGFSGDEDAALEGKLTACPGCGQLQRVGGETRKGVRRTRPLEPPQAGKRIDPAPTNPYSPPASHNPYKPPTKAWAEPQPAGNAPYRDVLHEAHIKAIAAWNLIVAALLFFGGILAVGFLPSGHPMKGPPMVLIVAMGVGYYIVGRPLWTLQGWSRWLNGGLIVLGILANVIGVIHDASTLPSAALSLPWSVAVLWALFCERAGPLFMPEYQDAIRSSTTEPQWARSPFFWGPIALCCLGGLVGGLAGAAGGG